MNQILQSSLKTRLKQTQRRLGSNTSIQGGYKIGRENQSDNIDIGLVKEVL